MKQFGSIGFNFIFDSDWDVTFEPVEYHNLSRIHNPEGYSTSATLTYGPIYHYYRKDHLGNKREVWCANTNTTLQRTHYYPSGLPWRTTTGIGAGVQNRKFNDCEFIEMHGYDVTDLGNRGVFHATNRFTSIDRFAEKFPWQSPYVFAGNNPVNYVDVNGDSIWINYNDANGQQQRLLYTNGMTYNGSDKVVAQQINSLNSMNKTKNGSTVLTELSNSINHFNITNNQSASGTAGFMGYGSGGGEFLMNGRNDLLNISHEMFHAFQHENGQGGRSIANELEAYLFSDGVNLEFNGGMGAAGSYSQSQSNSKDGQIYANELTKLLHSGSFNTQSFNIAVNLFKNNSGAKQTGIYNNYPLRRSNQIINLIQKFYPLY